MVKVDGVVGAGCEEGLGRGVFEGEVRAGCDGAGGFREGEGAGGCEF